MACVVTMTASFTARLSQLRVCHGAVHKWHTMSDESTVGPLGGCVDGLREPCGRLVGTLWTELAALVTS